MTWIRRTLYWHLFVAIVSAANAAWGVQSSSKVYRVGLLAQISPDRPQIKGLRYGLKEAGYIERENLELRMPFSSTVGQLQVVAKSYIKSKIDVIVTTGGVETRVAKDFTNGIATVFMPITDPVKSGFVLSLSHPGTNMTGISFTGDVREHGKQLEIFKELVPNLRRMVVLYDDRHPAAMISLREVRRAAEHFKLELHEIPVKTIAEAEGTISDLQKSKSEGIYLVCSSIFADTEKLAAMAKNRRIPFHSCTSDAVVIGQALFAYARDFFSIGRRGAWYVDRILKGARPQELPVETPSRFELTINLKTANAIGIKIPPEVLQRADKVIR